MPRYLPEAAKRVPAFAPGPDMQRNSAALLNSVEEHAKGQGL